MVLHLKVSMSTVLEDATNDYCESNFGELRNFKPLDLPKSRFTINNNTQVSTTSIKWNYFLF